MPQTIPQAETMKSFQPAIFLPKFGKWERQGHTAPCRQTANTVKTLIPFLAKSNLAGTLGIGVSAQ